MKVGLNQQTKNLSKIQKRKEKEADNRASIAAIVAGDAIPVALAPIGMLSTKALPKIAGKLSKEQTKTIVDCAEKMIIDTGLAKKGVNIVNLTSFEKPTLNLTSDGIFNSTKLFSEIAEGKNAAFFPKATKLTEIISYSNNSILVNKDKFSPALFHEIGHAINYNSSKFWKVMQKTRKPGMIMASYIMLFGALTKKAEPKDGKELTKAQKVKNFIREHAGALVAISLLPMVSEEVMASFRGIKYAAKNLPKELVQTVRKTNTFGAISYINKAVGLALAAHTAVKVKDYFTEKQKVKALQDKQQ